MSDVREFKHPEKSPSDYLEAKDPMLDAFNLSPEARLIYLRIIRESEPGVLLRCDRMAVELAAHAVDRALKQDSSDEAVNSIRECFASLLMPDLGQEYIDQVAAL
jgi:hypothetical protein